MATTALKIVFGADTTELKQAFQEVEKASKTTKAQLNDIKKALKMDPGNTELLAMKMRKLGEAVEGTKKKLELLKKQEAEIKKGLEAGTHTQESYDAVRLAIAKTSAELNTLTSSLQSANAEWAQSKSKLAAVSEGLNNAGTKMINAGDKIAGVGKKMTVALTGAVTAIGTASYKAWSEVDEGLDTISKKTGAVGDDMERFRGVFENVFGSLPASAGKAGEAIGEVNTQFGYYGKELEEASACAIKFAEANDADVTKSVQGAKAVIEQFGLSASSFGDVLDVMTVTAQATGQSTDALFEAVRKGGPALTALGLSMEESVVFMGKFMQSGIDSTAVLTALRTAQVKAAKDGMTLGEALQLFEEHAMDASRHQENLTEAVELFGSKAGPAMLEAVKSGKLNFDELQNMLANTKGAVDRTFDGIQDAPDKLKVAMNNLKIAGASLMDSFLPMVEPVIQKITEYAKKLSDWFQSLSPEMQSMVVKIGLLVAALGPLVTIGGNVIKVFGAFTKAFSTVPKIIGGVGKAFSTLRTAMSGISQAFAVVPKAVSAVASGFSTVASAAKGAVSAVLSAAQTIVPQVLNIVSSGMSSLASFASSAASTVGSVAKSLGSKAVGAVSTGVSAISTAAKAAVPALGGLVSSLGGVVVAAAPYLAIAGAVVAAGVAIYKNWDTIKEYAGKAWNAICNVCTSAWEGLKSAASSVWGAISSTVSSAWEGIKSGASSAWQSVSSTVSSWTTTACNAVSTGWTAAKTILGTVWEGTKSVASSAWQSISSTVSSWTTTACNAVSTGWTAAKAILGTVWEGTKSVASSVWSGISSAVSSATEASTSFLSSAWNSASSFISSVWGSIKSGASSVWSSIGNAIKSIGGPIEWAKSAFASLRDALVGAFNSIANWASNAWNKVKGLLSASSQAKGATGGGGGGGGGGGSAASVSWYDSGGVFRRPTIIGVGERRPEFVGALDDLRKIVREETANNSVMITGNSFVVREEADINKIATALARKMERRQLAF